jgi:uncharacterized RDD family membrane protein YckC
MLKEVTTRAHIATAPPAQPVSTISAAASIARRPALWRRVAASLIDRLAPLPCIALVYPRWALVVFAYHLLADCTPERRSVGRWVCRLRVVSAASDGPCRWWQAVLRRGGIAVTQTAWCLWEFVPFVLLYELIALASALLDAQGRRPEDFAARTRVVSEKEFSRLQKLQRRR